MLIPATLSICRNIFFARNFFVASAHSFRSVARPSVNWNLLSAPWRLNLICTLRRVDANFGDGFE